MKTIKQILMTAVALLLSLSVNAHGFKVGGIFYNITSETTVEVANDGANKYSGNITIPETVSYDEKSYSVTGIGNDAFQYCVGLTGVEIPGSVTSIGDYAFQNCIELKSIEIPGSVTSIGKYAFTFCMKLTEIRISNSVTSIGEGSFAGCFGIKSLTVDSGNAVYDSRDNCNAVIETASNTLISGCDISVIPNSVTTIGNNAFSCCGFTSIEIPSSVTTIGDYAFDICLNLKSVVIPASVTHIGNKVFNGNYAIESVIVDSDNTVYDSRDNCNALIETASNTLILGCKNTVIPNSITTIGKMAFGACNFASITIPNSVTTIDDMAFTASTLTSITIPGSVTSMGEHVFYDCPYLESVTFSDGATVIGYAAFAYCGALTDVEIPASVKKIEESAFEGCTALTDITLPLGVTTIEDWVFYECSGLKSIIIPESVTSMGCGIFVSCTSLTSVTLPSGITNIGEYTFYECTELASICLMNPVPATVESENFTDSHYANTTVYVPQGSLAAYKAADVWKDFANIKEFNTTQIDNVDAGDISITATANGIALLNAKGKAVTVHTPNGTRVASINSYAGEEINLEKGVYIVRTGDITIKVRI